MKLENPDAKFIAHPECEENILAFADFIGSTSALLNFTQTQNDQKFIVATESGILHQMQKASPLKIFIPAPPEENCACNDCPHMKKIQLKNLSLHEKSQTRNYYFRRTNFKSINSNQKMIEMSN